MKAQDARQLSYEFYKSRIDDIIKEINYQASQGNSSTDVVHLPSAIESYFLENGFRITKIGGNLAFISWEL